MAPIHFLGSWDLNRPVELEEQKESGDPRLPTSFMSNNVSNGHERGRGSYVTNSVAASAADVIGAALGLAEVRAFAFAGMEGKTVVRMRTRERGRAEYVKRE